MAQGFLTCELAKRGYQMIGVEPSSHMLDLARKSDCADQIEWIQGDALVLGERGADLAIMTGHVAQFHLENEYWSSSLKSIYNSLRPGGYLVFESRNPAVQPWVNKKDHIDWHSSTSPHKAIDPIAGPLETWSEPVKIDDERVIFEGHYLFTKTGEELISINELIFRTKEEIIQFLESAGFLIENIYGNWDWSQVSKESPEFIFVARR